MDLKHKIWLWSVILVLSLISLQSFLIIFHPFSTSLVDAKATNANFAVCLNHRPEFLDFPCNTTLRQGLLYSCRLNVSDFDNDVLSFSAVNESGYSLIFNVSSDGVISTVPVDTDVGLNKILFSVFDDSGCSNNYSTSEISFNVENINDPPVFIPPMGPFSWSLDGSYRGVFLNNYFIDPDNDPLTFSHSLVPEGFLVTVTNIGEVIFSASECGEGSMVFSATDIHNASVSSTPVLLSVPCPQKESSSSSSSSVSSGSCIPSWKCSDWLDCSENGTQKKVCNDIARCEDETLSFWRNCTYRPLCENGFLDPGEDGVDCGGPCPACPSCFDGVQNQGELGVDCGGPCPACMDVEVPKPIKSSNKVLFWILGSIAFMSLLLIFYRLFYRKIQNLFAKLSLLFIKKHQKTILLSDHHRDLLLEELSVLEDKNLLSSKDSADWLVFQDELSVILRKLFVFIIGNTFDIDKADDLISNLKIPFLLKNILKKHYVGLLLLEQSVSLSPVSLQFNLELLRLRILSLSKFDRSLVARETEELSEIGDSLKSFYGILHNLYLALQFNKLSLAKKKYLSALNLYSHLPVPEQSEVFTSLHLSFDDIRYISSFSKK